MRWLVRVFLICSLGLWIFIASAQEVSEKEKQALHKELNRIHLLILDKKEKEAISLLLDQLVAVQRRMITTAILRAKDKGLVAIVKDLEGPLSPEELAGKTALVKNLGAAFVEPELALALREIMGQLDKAATQFSAKIREPTVVAGSEVSITVLPASQLR